MEAALKKLTAERGLVKAALTRFGNYFETRHPSESVKELQERLVRFLPLADKFEAIQNQIDLYVEGTEAATAQGSERESFERTYYRLSAAAKHIIEQSRPRTENVPRMLTPNTSTPSISDSRSGLQLPVIKLPTFDGAYDTWIRFRDSFQSMIDNNDTLTNIQKYHYLNSALKGEAARVINSLGVSDDNYVQAWANLKKRYEDPQTLIRHHTKALFELPNITKVSCTTLRQLIDDTNNHLSSLKSLDQPTRYWDTLIVHLITTKLDNTTRREWDKRLISRTDNPTLDDFMTFLDQQCKFLSRSQSDRPIGRQNDTIHVRDNKPRTVSYVANTNSSCRICNGQHALYHCEKFRKLTPDERLVQVKTLHVCFNCLIAGHGSKDCTRSNCRRCNKKHHTLLHIESGTNNAQCKSTIETQEPGNSVTLTQTHRAENSHVFLATALVHILDNSGKKHKCRALLDAGSQSHFLTKDFCDKLKLKCTSTTRTISGIGHVTNNVTQETRTTLFSRQNDFNANISCLVIRKITDQLPTEPISNIPFHIPSNIKLADPDFNTTGKIDMLIGGELFWNLLCVGQYKLGPGCPLLQKTQLGWVIAGQMTVPKSLRNSNSTCHLVTNDELHNDLQKFWEVENVIKDEDTISLDDHNPFEKHFIETTTRDASGRYIVKIPFKTNIKELGDSLQFAKKRFASVEKRLNLNPSLKNKYIAFMQEYEDLGHMTKVSNYITPDTKTFYLPHHAVIKEGSTTTKLRVVFDGSAKTTTGVSLNDVQSIGPVVQDDLFSIVLRFRKHAYVLSADIAKMYRQILISPEERRYQRILWRPNSSLPLSVYELNTITYGTASAPFLATRTLRQIGEEWTEEFPRASEAIIRDFYVDDLLTGGDTLEETIKLKQQITQILDNAGMELRKWASNDTRVINQHSGQQVEITAEKDPKTLGIAWISNKDMIRFTVKSAIHRRVTKRILLSEIAQIFDPLGLVGPATIVAKMMMQQLWQMKTTWDESLPQEMHCKWEQFRVQLNDLNRLSIPRHAVCQDPVAIEMHGFCDASEKAYGACIYLRSTNTDGRHTVRLLCAKSRVAPLKKITLPRLELCGALLLAQLAKKVRVALQSPLTNEYYWCDSTITLAWIKSPSSRWKTFVAHRTAEIQNSTNDNWNHVGSEENPADVISRGISPTTLIDLNIWWTGPPWLSEDSDNWPKTETHIDNVPEAKIITKTFITATQDQFHIFNRYSSYLKLLRVTAYCMRFIVRIRHRKIHKKSHLSHNNDTHSNALSVEEIEQARIALLRLAQRESFIEEYKQLENKQSILKTSKIISLTPFIDNKGILRVGGRLSNASIPYEQQHPAILAAKHPFTTLIIRYEHMRLLHAGNQAVLASVRTRYWPLAAKNVVKGILRQCITCFRLRPGSHEYAMGDLPASRVTPRRPFHTCGVDYAGPFLIKERARARTTIKAYVCIFVCFATKATHIELAVDLSTNAFLNCFRRFISRRGRCHSIYSDNGTNFVGARNELKELGLLLQTAEHNTKLSQFLSTEQIQWHFIPPHAPHFGGLWESAVKSAKHHLKRVVGETRLSFEELYTLLAQVEACMNSRPICPLSDDPTDLTPLTPGHFLIGESMTALPHPDLRDVKVNRVNRFEHISKMLQHFWERWHSEYLHQLQQRHKWKTAVPSKFGVGTLVLIKEDNIPPLRWRTGRIEELHPGKDNVTRVVSIRMSDGIIKRPVAKICILPIADDEDINYNNVKT